MADPNSPIEIAWSKSRELLEAGDLSAASEALGELNSAKLAAGFDSLDDYSLGLIALGIQTLKKGDFETAAFLGRKALELSPNSSWILIQSIPLLSGASNQSPVKLGLRALYKLPDSYDLLARIVPFIIPPILVSLTVAAYFALSLFLAFQMPFLLRRTAIKLPPLTRGFLAPCLIAAFIGTPFFLGPLWCLVLWSLIVLVRFPDKRWLAFYSGMTLVLWGVLIPIRENLILWMESPGTEAMLRVASGVYSPTGRQEISKLLERRPHDSFALFTYGTLLKRDQNLKEAEEVFKLAGKYEKKLWPLTEFELGTIAYLQGAMHQAQEHFNNAESDGLETAGLFFNISKVYYQLSDSKAGLEYFQRAQELDRDLTKLLAQREDKFGPRSVASLGEASLPLTQLWKTALVPIEHSARLSDEILSPLMPGLGPLGVSLCGGLLMLLFLFKRIDSVPVQRQKFFYTKFTHSSLTKAFYRMFPGGSWILTGKPSQGFAAIAISSLLAMPLLGFPRQLGEVLELVPGWFPYYASIAALLILGVIYIGYHLEEEF